MTKCSEHHKAWQNSEILCQNKTKRRPSTEDLTNFEQEHSTELVSPGYAIICDRKLSDQGAVIPYRNKNNKSSVIC